MPKSELPVSESTSWTSEPCVCPTCGVAYVRKSLFVLNDACMFAEQARSNATDDVALAIREFKKGNQLVVARELETEEQQFLRGLRKGNRGLLRGR